MFIRDPATPAEFTLWHRVAVTLVGLALAIALYALAEVWYFSIFIYIIYQPVCIIYLLWAWLHE